MDDGSTLSVGFTGPLICVVLAGLGLSATKDIDATATSSLSSSHTAGDSLAAFQNRMVEVGTWVFDHNGLRGEVDRGSVTWTFTADGALIIEDSDGTTEKTYSLVKRCGDYGEIGGGNVAYLRVTSAGGNEDCYVVGHLVNVGGAEGKILALDNDRGNSLYLIPAK
jgi:hypothetical protein